MGFMGLMGEIAVTPFRLARPIGGLLVDVGRAAVRSVVSPTTTFDADGMDLAHRRRRIWIGDRRAHIELREVGADDQADYLSSVVESLTERPEVGRVVLHPAVGRVVVDATTDVPAPAVEYADALDQVERELGLGSVSFGRHRPDHPADQEPLNEGLTAIAADVGGLLLAGMGRQLRVPSVPLELDLAALLTVASYVPWIRRSIEQRAESPALGISLAVSRAVANGLTQSFGGPVADIAHRTSGVVSAYARRAAWERLEPELMGWHEAASSSGVLRPAARPPMPDGPIEKSAAPMAIASMGAAGLGLLTKPDVDRAISFLVAGTPKAAKWGREAFAAHLSLLLHDRSILVLDLGALERLDRVDTLVIPGELLIDAVTGDAVPFAAELLAAARSGGVDVWVATDDPRSVDRLEIGGVVGSGTETAEAIVRMRSDRGVMLIASGSHPGFDVADVGLGLRTPGRAIAWNASMIGGTQLIDGYLLVLAVGAAKEASRQSADLALAGTGVAGLMAFGGVIPGNLSRVVGAVNLAALVAHANGARVAASLARQPLPDAPDTRPFHAMSPEEVLAVLESTVGGLSAAEAKVRTEPQPGELPALVLLARSIGQELVNPLTPFLAAGAGLSAAAGSVSDAALVAGVLALNAGIGGVQRYRAEQATAALLSRERSHVRVVRDGTTVTLTTEDLVPGDVVMVHAGDVVPADCRILTSHALEVDESNLTGESLPVEKNVAASRLTSAVADRASMLYSGTTIAAGSAQAVATAVGRHTEAYRGLLLADRRQADTGVEARLESLTALVTPASVLAGLGVLASGVARSRPMADVLSSGVSLAVAAVPEGLPLLATAAQQAAARRLAQRGVIVRNARAIEALGRIDIVCADKTGTLTLGKIRVACVSDGVVTEFPSGLTGARRRALAAARAATPDALAGERLPHPTDRAILYAVEEADLHRRDELGGWSKLEEIPFEPRRGYHATLGESDGHRMALVKGAPEVVLPRCRFRLSADGRRIAASAAARSGWADAIASLATRGLRVLVVAQRRLDDGSLGDTELASLTFLGLLGLEDPVRSTSRGAIADLRRAGVEVIMITGDHPITATGIATELDIDAGDLLTGEEIDRLTDAELSARLATVRVGARVTPAHKVRIVRALQQEGRVVAMTGDGANDAPAIRLADVGIALGTRATDAARDASDLVVTDDRFETIVSAVIEGRALWASVRDATAILVGGNIGEIAFTLTGALLTGTSPINTRQLLLVNLMTDVFPAMAIAVSTPPDVTPDHLLTEGPERSLGEALNRAIAERAAMTTLGTTAGWLAARATGRRKRAGTVALASLVGSELGQTLISGWHSPLVVASSLGSMAALVGVVQTPGLSRLFGCTPLGPVGWSQALTAAGLATAGGIVLPHLDAPHAVRVA